ncbi:MAG: hypothetical protein DLM62_07880 [Pseudonocardiales bacterium]|nr:MAG: hypothetical protein DLM62_07880 [Pseudonocardiales bacterium]
MAPIVPAPISQPDKHRSHDQREGGVEQCGRPDDEQYPQVELLREVIRQLPPVHHGYGQRDRRREPGDQSRVAAGFEAFGNAEVFPVRRCSTI